MIPWPIHEKTIKELRLKWAKELMFQKLRWENVEDKLKEFKKIKA